MTEALQTLEVTEPLRLFWWKGKPNFGDALSKIVTAYAAGRPVRHARPKYCEMFGLGSILQIAERNYRNPSENGNRPWVWGSGMMEGIGLGFRQNVRICMVRGPITASLMGIKSERYGDPGLLTAEALPAAGPREDKIGLLVHHSQLGDPRIQTALQAEPRLYYIDVQGKPERVCAEISKCAHVISSSLHGLVVADAYGIANTWLDPEGHARLKYYDYAASIGRVLPVPLKMDDIVAALPQLSQRALPYVDGIAKAKATLLEHFPAELRGAPKHTPVASGA